MKKEMSISEIYEHNVSNILKGNIENIIEGPNTVFQTVHYVNGTCGHNRSRSTSRVFSEINCPKCRVKLITAKGCMVPDSIKNIWMSEMYDSVFKEFGVKG